MRLGPVFMPTLSKQDATFQSFSAAPQFEVPEMGALGYPDFNLKSHAIDG
jgi:hypothetical protein